MGQRRQYVRQFFAYKDYFKDFKRTLTKDARDKLYAVLLLIMTIEASPSSTSRASKK